MEYLFLLILIATINSSRVVRRIVRTAGYYPDALGSDADVIAWVNIMVTSTDHAVITTHARNF